MIRTGAISLMWSAVLAGTATAADTLNYSQALTTWEGAGTSAPNVWVETDPNLPPDQLPEEASPIGTPFAKARSGPGYAQVATSVSFGTGGGSYADFTVQSADAFTSRNSIVTANQSVAGIASLRFDGLMSMFDPISDDDRLAAVLGGSGPRDIFSYSNFAQAFIRLKDTVTGDELGALAQLSYGRGVYVGTDEEPVYDSDGNIIGYDIVEQPPSFLTFDELLTYRASNRTGFEFIHREPFGGSVFDLTLSLPFNFVAGRQYELLIQTSCNTQVSADMQWFTGSFDGVNVGCDASRTALWKGVTGADGKPIAGFALSDGTTDFALSSAGPPGAIPEPGTWATMILGLGLAGYALRRRGAFALA